MARTPIYQIPGKLNVEWDTDAKCVVDTWSSYSISLDEFKQAILGRAVLYAKPRGAVGWIVDSSKATGAFTQEIQHFIGETLFPKFAEIGIKYFITIPPQNAVTSLTVKSFSRKAGPNGMELIEVQSIEAAVQFVTTGGKKA
ncbi:MAG TPA: hypothetical protein VMI31_17190, partial [Fimbriimonadaceae bacterium]|nr:hypothetical protein [Fimbriimonadaceae bacterium]